MRGFYQIVLTGFILFGASSVHAADLTDRQLKSPCTPSPAIGNGNYPGFSSIQTSNRIAKPTGKPDPGAGQPVYFFARVFDRDCVPVSEAKVELWHADPNGRFRFATKAALATPDALFAGGGRTTTDNLGEFLFFTLYPGPYQYTITKKGPNGETIKELIKRAPHFNLKITHPDFSAFDTTLYFRGDSRNGEDHLLKKQSADVRERVMMTIGPRGGDWNLGAQVTFDIVLPSKSPWRRF